MKPLLTVLLFLTACTFAQEPPYDVYPEPEPPYYLVRYEAAGGAESIGGLAFAVKYTLWVPPGVETLRGVIVHQHGCGEGSCKSGLTGAYDLHWQALAKKHDCALLAPSYEQPADGECRLWSDPRHGSDAAFHQALKDLGAQSGHPELAAVPWALWGHSGGAHWAAVMTLLHPDQVVATWLRSGAALLVPHPERPEAETVALSEGALDVPMMLNPGTKEGVTEKDGKFSGVWPTMQRFLKPLREKGGLVGVAVDPLTSHECGNQRYLAIPWFDVCLTRRLPAAAGGALRPMPQRDAWLAPAPGSETAPGTASIAVPEAEFPRDKATAIWLPNEAIAKAWMEYVRDTRVTDTTPPPAPVNLQVKAGVLTWEAEADLESGIGHFIIERDGEEIATVPAKPANPFGRPLFQGLQYSDTPSQPLVAMQFEDTAATAGSHRYRVISVNTVGLKSN